MTALSRTELDVAQCQTPGCDHSGHESVLFIHSQCHPSAHLILSYDRECGELEVACAKCGEAVAAIAVAEETGLSTPYPRQEKPAADERTRVTSQAHAMSETVLTLLSTVDAPTGMTVMAISTAQYLFKISPTRKAFRGLMKDFGAELRRVCMAYWKAWDDEYRLPDDGGSP